jgi:hypothetical protein
MFGIFFTACFLIMLDVLAVLLYWPLGIALFILQTPIWWIYFWTTVDYLIEVLE